MPRYSECDTTTAGPTYGELSRSSPAAGGPILARMATVLPFRPRSAVAGSRPYKGRLSRARGRGAVAARQGIALLRDFNSAAAWAGVTTFLWYAVGMVPVQIAVIGHF